MHPRHTGGYRHGERSVHAHVFGAAALDHCGDAFSAFVTRNTRPHRDNFTGCLQAGNRQMAPEANDRNASRSGIGPPD